MRISLVTGTIGRVDTLQRLLRSLETQTYPNFELIIVDQNDDDRVDRVLKSFHDLLDIKHIQLNEKGLSRARNCGLKHVDGEVVGFPDDDCWYTPDVLSRVADFFAENTDWHGLTGKSIDSSGRPSSGRWDENEGPVNKQNVWQRAISYTIFIRRNIIDTVGEFDERLGVGALTLLGSGEETDYLLRALSEGYRLWYKPQLAIRHPAKTDSYTQDAVERAYFYGVGMGYLMQKHDYSLLFVLSYIVRSVGGVLLGIAKREKIMIRYYLSVLTGRVHGFLKDPAELRSSNN